MSRLNVRLVPTGPGGEREPGGVVWSVSRFPCLIGRHPDSDIVLGGPLVSRRHCALMAHDGGVWVEDIGSRHGTLLNGQRVRGARLLWDGDRLDLPGSSFLVCLTGEAAPAAAGDRRRRRAAALAGRHGAAGDAPRQP